MHRVVITGLGAITPLGHDPASFWDSLKRGDDGIRPVELVPTDRLNQKVLGEVKGFDPQKHFGERELPILDRVSQFSIVAAKQAVAQSGLTFDGELSERTATIIGTGVGGQTTVDESFKRLYEDKQPRVYPLTIPKLMPNAPASQISMHCGLRGPAFGIVSACASATHAIGLCFQMVRSGAVQCAVTGGAEAAITLGAIKGWEAMRVMSPDKVRPFSKDRKGMIIGEGAAIAVLETEEDARKRGANILCEIAGFGMSADAKDITAPDVNGMVRAMNGALKDAKLNVQDIQYVNAHGTGTTANDRTETAALKVAFGHHAKKIAISSTKSMTGHALGAAGAIELVATVMGIRAEVAAPTINYIGPDPECDLDYVPNEARDLKIDAAMSNSFAFGGLNAVLVLKQYRG
ncbi:MAG TPA: beta-ketoacyl-[acyl-carrier-protein] synthase family protein [Pseudolabrys sp.]|nr:beta-ketoacyl-[acyl-carrier-protein] synthase family protein [Pseudolabrys sp.]